MLSCIKLPQYVCSKIDSRCTDFFGDMMPVVGRSTWQIATHFSAPYQKEDWVCEARNTSTLLCLQNNCGGFLKRLRAPCRLPPCQPNTLIPMVQIFSGTYIMHHGCGKVSSLAHKSSYLSYNGKLVLAHKCLSTTILAYAITISTIGRPSYCCRSNHAYTSSRTSNSMEYWLAERILLAWSSHNHLLHSSGLYSSKWWTYLDRLPIGYLYC